MSDSRQAFEVLAKRDWDIRRVHKMNGSEVLPELEEYYPRADLNVAWEFWQAAWQSRDAEVAGLREALASISLAERDATSSDREKVVSMARIARQALAANPTSERVVQS